MTENTNAKKKRNFKPKAKKQVSKENLGEGTIIGAKKKETKKAPKKSTNKVGSKKEIKKEQVVELKQTENEAAARLMDSLIKKKGGHHAEITNYSARWSGRNWKEHNCI